jgi:hypothetical protein
LFQDATQQENHRSGDLRWFEAQYGIERDREAPWGDARESADEAGPADDCKRPGGAAHEATDTCKPGKCGVLCPPIQIAGMQNAIRGINRERSAAQHSVQHDLEDIVVEIAESDIAHREIHQARKRLHLCPILSTDNFSRARNQKLSGIPANSQIGSIRGQKLAALLTLRRCEMPAVFGRAPEIDCQLLEHLCVPGPFR